LKQGYSTSQPKLEYKTMAEWLDVTPAEAEVVSQVLYGKCQPGDRRFFPAAQRFGQLEPVTTVTGEKTRRTKLLILRSFFMESQELSAIIGHECNNDLPL
jgi:hypothetical protein